MTFDTPPLPLPGEYPYDHHHHYHHHHRQHDVAIYESRYQCLLICVATDHPFNVCGNCFPSFPLLSLLSDRRALSLYIITNVKIQLIVPRVQNARPTTTTIMAARDTIIDDGGEGLILQQALSTYQSGRSSSLFKLKVLYSRYSTLSTLLYVLLSTQHIRSSFAAPATSFCS